MRIRGFVDSSGGASRSVPSRSLEVFASNHQATHLSPIVMAPSSVFLSADRLRRMGRASRNYTIGWAMHWWWSPRWWLPTTEMETIIIAPGMIARDSLAAPISAPYKRLAYTFTHIHSHSHKNRHTRRILRTSWDPCYTWSSRSSHRFLGRFT